LRQALAATRKKNITVTWRSSESSLLQHLRHPSYEQVPPPLLEGAEDFEITAIESAQICDSEDRSGPFAIIAIARA
jgi:hypothetical protein